jgi:hypothetical protein
MHRVCRPARSARSPQGSSRPVHSTPQRLRHLSRFPARFWCPGGPRIQGRQALHPRPRPASGVVNSEPFWERPAGTQTHSRRTGGKLGQVRDARQALVRVPESNTKYGGHGGKPRGLATPWMGASISESSGIPKRKKIEREPSTGVTPRVHRPSIFHPLAIAFSGLR